MSQGMSQFLSEYYGNNGSTKTAAANEDLVEQAQVELFCKVAAEQGVDIQSMSDDQVQRLYSNFTSKIASPDLTTVASQELAEKQAAAQKVAEADQLGRIMAHSFVDEQAKIAAGGDGEDKDDEEDDEERKKKVAGVGDSLKKGLEHVKGHASKAWEKTKGAPAAVGRHLESVGTKVDNKMHGRGFNPNRHHATSTGKAKAIGAGVYGGGAAAAGGAGYGAHRAYKNHKEKRSSAIDELALEAAVVKAAEAGFDATEAALRLDAALTLGAFEGDSAKVASAPDLETAVGIRALEMLEAVNYPVTWG